MRSIDARRLRGFTTPAPSAEPAAVSGPSEQVASFPCFGSRCTVIVAGSQSWADAAGAVEMARQRLLEWHDRFSRFLPESELSRLNTDPRREVPVTPLMRRLLEAAVHAATLTGGLVDPTLTTEIEQAGYAEHFDESDPDRPALEQALTLAPPRAPATARSAAAWREIRIERARGQVIRPPGLRLDPGGIAKGLFADELAVRLGAFDAAVIDCGGDLRLGGSRGIRRPVAVQSPFDASTLHTFALSEGGVATSGIGKRSWMHRGRPAHHLLDPGSGRPAFTGVVQATALAPTAAEAEARSKAAVLSGPDRADEWLEFGGVVVYDDGSFRVV
jgi:thiamine biosynthesis lipoprotein